jgi:hypothetical protein
MSEKIYDEQIAPLLLEVATLCKEHGLPMVATVWFDGEDSGTTRIPPEGEHPPFVLAHAACRSRGNLDSLCMALSRAYPMGTHNSIVLAMLQQGS